MSERLDVHLVRVGLARSRGEASELVRQGAVSLAGTVVRRPAHPVGPGVTADVHRDEPGWVGRGAVKLHGALETLGPAGPRVRGARCVDVGASTGGFTQVLLRRGAASVAAIDVGHGQLARAVAEDPRVVDRSGTTVRGLDPCAVGGPFDLLVADLSFVSLVTVAPDLASLVKNDGDAVVLVKPQFEVGRERLGKNGIVRAATARREAVLRVARALAVSGLHPRRVLASPVAGTTGNHEYLLWVTRSATVGDGGAAEAPDPPGTEVGPTWEALETEITTIIATEEGR